MRASSAVSEDLRLGRRVATAIVVAMVVAAYALHAALPATPFRLPIVPQQYVKSILPEGWAFFTADPREPQLTSYGLEPDGTWRRLTLRSSMTPGSTFGLDRWKRSQGTEVAIITSQLAAPDWSACEDTPTDCLTRAPVARTVTNRSTHHTLCGEVGLVAQEVVPWAWQGLPTVMSSQVTRVVVTC